MVPKLKKLLTHTLSPYYNYGYNAYTPSIGNANSNNQIGYSSISFISGSFLSFQILIKSSDVGPASTFAFLGPLIQNLFDLNKIIQLQELYF